jgi:hypothetical protein
MQMCPPHSPTSSRISRSISRSISISRSNHSNHSNHSKVPVYGVQYEGWGPLDTGLSGRAAQAAICGTCQRNNQRNIAALATRLHRGTICYSQRWLEMVVQAWLDRAAYLLTARPEPGLPSALCWSEHLHVWSMHNNPFFFKF